MYKAEKRLKLTGCWSSCQTSCNASSLQRSFRRNSVIATWKMRVVRRSIFVQLSVIIWSYVSRTSRVRPSVQISGGFTANVIVNFVKTVFAGPETLQEAQAKINVAVETYTSTIVDLGASIGIQLFIQGKKIEEKIDNLSSQFQQLFMSGDNRFSGNLNLT